MHPESPALHGHTLPWTTLPRLFSRQHVVPARAYPIRTAILVPRQACLHLIRLWKGCCPPRGSRRHWVIPFLTEPRSSTTVLSHSSAMRSPAVSPGTLGAPHCSSRSEERRVG